MPRLLGPIDCAYTTYKSSWVSKEKEEEGEEVEGRERRRFRTEFKICLWERRNNDSIWENGQQHT